MVFSFFLCHADTVLGPLQSVMQDLHSDDNDDDSEDDDDNDMDSDMERPAHTHLTHHQRRLVNGLKSPTNCNHRHSYTKCQLLEPLSSEPIHTSVCLYRLIKVK